MHTQNVLSAPTSLHKQQGIATVLLVVFIGIALIATSFGVMHSIRGTQEQQVAAHASTHAQNGVWTGVEAFRLYLGSLEEDVLLALDDVVGAEYNIELTDAGDVVQDFYGAISVADVSVSAPVGDVYQISATITNTNTQAQAAAAVGAVFEYEKPPCSDCVDLTATLDFHDDLVAGGEINITSPPGTLPTINIDGSAHMPNIAISRLQALNATGSVSLDSAVSADEIHSNGDVILSGSANAHSVKAIGIVSVSGGASAGNIWADGNVSYTSSTSYVNPETSTAVPLDISTQGHIESTTTGHNTFIADGDINIMREADGGSQSGNYAHLESGGNVTIDNTNASVSKILAKGNLLCPNNNWPSSLYDDITVGGSIQASCVSAAADALVPGSAVSIDPALNVTDVQAVPAYTVPSAIVDVWPLKQFANYVIEYDEDASRTKITVYNINGIPHGTSYYLGNYDGVAKKSFLCETVDVDGNCETPTAANAIGSICLGQSEWNSCLFHSVVAGVNTWKFEGKGMAPGVYFIDGDVTLDNGRNYSTVLVAGNLTTNGALVQTSINYGDYAEVCEAVGTGLNEPIFTSRFSQQYPTNLCDTDAGELIVKDFGNLGIAVGGYRPEDAGAFTGGNVYLDDNTVVNGIVLAGNYLETGGSVVVNGFMSAAVQGGRGAQDNILGGSTTMNLHSDRPNYIPNRVPDMSDGACPDCGNEGYPENTPRSKLLWSKYL